MLVMTFPALLIMGVTWLRGMAQLMRDAGDSSQSRSFGERGKEGREAWANGVRGRGG